MTQNLSSIADVTSDLGSRMRATLDNRKSQLEIDRALRLERVQQKVDDLKSRGLLKKQRCIITTTADFERKYHI